MSGQEGQLLHVGRKISGQRRPITTCRQEDIGLAHIHDGCSAASVGPSENSQAQTKETDLWESFIAVIREGNILLFFRAVGSNLQRRQGNIGSHGSPTVVDETHENRAFGKNREKKFSFRPFPATQMKSGAPMIELVLVMRLRRSSI